MLNNNLTIIKKAYHVYHNGMFHNYFECAPWTVESDARIIYSSSASKAKSEMVRLQYEEMDIKTEEGEYPTYTDLIAKRAKRSDKIIVKGKEYIRWQYESELENNKIITQKLTFLEKHPDDQLYYVQAIKHGFVGNSVIWWGPDHAGYPINIEKAGLYTKDQCAYLANYKNDVYFWPKEHVEQAISKHVDMQHLHAKLRG